MVLLALDIFHGHVKHVGMSCLLRILQSHFSKHTDSNHFDEHMHRS